MELVWETMKEKRSEKAGRDPMGSRDNASEKVSKLILCGTVFPKRATVGNENTSRMFVRGNLEEKDTSNLPPRKGLKRTRWMEKVEKKERI